ncbi:unnamed protein product [Acanthosepion pharaonis]|uniref:Uncharacterized protein n=1 Tax=Acanthosepion pharaonis TaxID=158019 RepID=A0A812DTX4_ACAPH|nr:unnamed protein product [Sepia pharaonis]
MLIPFTFTCNLVFNHYPSFFLFIPHSLERSSLFFLLPSIDTFSFHLYIIFTQPSLSLLTSLLYFLAFFLISLTIGFFLLISFLFSPLSYTSFSFLFYSLSFLLFRLLPPLLHYLQLSFSFYSLFYSLFLLLFLLISFFSYLLFSIPILSLLFSFLKFDIINLFSSPSLIVSRIDFSSTTSIVSRIASYSLSVTMVFPSTSLIVSLLSLFLYQCILHSFLFN